MLATAINAKEERRRHLRVMVKQNTMAFNSTTFGEVMDLSTGGLRMKCLLHGDDKFETSFRIGLLSSSGDYYLDNLPCKVISIKDSSPLRSSRSTFVREAGIMFMNLNADQQAKLSLFLQKNRMVQS